jgi:hypothetical protein
MEQSGRNWKSDLFLPTGGLTETEDERDTGRNR